MGISFRATAPVDLSTGDQKTNVLCVMDDIDADLALDSAVDLLDAIQGGLLDILDEPSVSRRVVLLLHAAETATALVRAAWRVGRWPMTSRTVRTRSQMLGDLIQGYVGAIHDMAAAVREDLAFEGSDPGPRLTAEQVDAIHLSIITIARLAGEDLIQLLTELEVPA
ncbi:hypothetical protein [Pseudomonas aeruginosa]|uniref:hypothetical protein n=1 Tax=Pseudomonas aeruginosa TaxID=287 RepID=UPI001F2EEAC2|nr:hypothetical protein [Pseudomonas aeruginosa]